VAQNPGFLKPAHTFRAILDEFVGKQEVRVEQRAAQEG